jgi:prevent-host-death family protein
MLDYYWLMQTVSVSEAKASLNALVEKVVNTWEPVTLTRHGQPLVVIQAVADFDATQETLDWLSDPKTLPAVREANAEIAEGSPGATVAQMRAELGLASLDG